MLRDLWGGSGDKYTDTDVRHIVIRQTEVNIDFVSFTDRSNLHHSALAYKDIQRLGDAEMKWINA